MNIRFLSIFAGMFMILGASVAISGVYAQEVEGQFVIQNTSASIQDPLPGHESHQIIIVAPPQEGAVYSGRATWTASAPVEAVVLHPYSNASVANTNATGSQLTAPFGDGEVAISLIQQESGTPVEAGSLEFAGSAFALHNIEGTPFTATYSLVADVVTAPEGADAAADEDDEGADAATDEEATDEEATDEEE